MRGKLLPPILPISSGAEAGLQHRIHNGVVEPDLLIRPCLVSAFPNARVRLAGAEVIASWTVGMTAFRRRTAARAKCGRARARRRKLVQRWARRVMLTSDNLVRVRFHADQKRVSICGSGVPKQIMAALPGTLKRHRARGTERNVIQRACVNSVYGSRCSWKF